MKTYTYNKVFVFILALFTAGFFTACFNAVTESVFTDAGREINQLYRYMVKCKPGEIT